MFVYSLNRCSQRLLPVSFSRLIIAIVFSMSNLHVPELVVLLLVAVCSISSQKYPDDFKLILTNQTVSLSPYPVDFGSRAFDSQNKIGLSSEDPDANKDVIELVRSRGFQVKTYNPITPDGYILTAFRIINPFNQRPRLAKPVMLQHGFETSASSWVWQPEGKATAPLNPRSVRKGTITNGSLGFVLANYGYDVWLTNFRGTRYATNHTRLGSPGQTGQYWEFSVNELSRFDIPTYLRYIQKVTKQSKKGGNVLHFVFISTHLHLTHFIFSNVQWRSLLLATLWPLRPCSPHWPLSAI